MKKAAQFLFLLLPILTIAQYNKERDVSYSADKNLVKAVYYHANGEISQTGTYNDKGQLHGSWISYDEHGKKLAMGNYLAGKREGKWFFWNQEGLTEVDFSDNSIAAVNHWKEAPAIVSNR